MKKTIIFLLVTLMFFAACTPTASQNGSPQPTAELDEVPTEEPVQTDNPEETAEPVETPEPAETEEPASPTPEPEAYKPHDKFEQLISDSYQCINEGNYYALVDYHVGIDDEYVTLMLENGTGFASSEYYKINFIHEIDHDFVKHNVLNWVLYGISKNNLPMPRYLEDDSLVKSFFVCLETKPKGYGDYDYHCHTDLLCILVNDDGQWKIFREVKNFYSQYLSEGYPDPHEIYKNTDE